MDFLEAFKSFDLAWWCCLAVTWLRTVWRALLDRNSEGSVKVRKHVGVSFPFRFKLSILHLTAGLVLV